MSRIPGLIAILLVTAASPAAEPERAMVVHRSAMDPLPYLALELPLPPELASAPTAPSRVELQCRLEDAEAGTRIVPLYAVTTRQTTPDGDERLQLVARLPQDAQLPAQLEVVAETWWPGQRWSTGVTTHTLDARAATPAEGEALVARWRSGYRALLARRCARLADQELELLLHRRFFGRFPANERRRAGDPELVDFLEAILGIDELRSAIPEGEDGTLAIAERSEPAPEPLLLPQVPVPADAPATPADDPCWYVPRSCGALAFDRIAELETGLHALAELIERWSPGTWTRSAPAILEDRLGALGLDPETRARLQDAGPVHITLAAWDPFFDAGTNLLAVLRAERPLAPPPGAPHHHQAEDGRVLVLATGERLLRMAVDARDQGRSLAQDPHYAAARARLVARDGADERAFLFLSDHWLTNFISPRWRILDARRRELDARIRLVELLRLVRMRELDLDAPPELVALRADPWLDAGILDWLLAGLELRDGAVVHAELGGIGDHPPIDQLPFERVTPQEAAAYERFRLAYQNRWRQMDPIAFQLERVAADRWHARLYVSPISRRSDWRILRDLVLPQKLRQHVASGPGFAAGVAVTLSTTSLAPMLGGIQLPVTTTVQLLALDTAPISYAPDTWLEDAPAQDQLSWLRVPAAVLAPRVLFERLSPLVLRGPERAAIEDDIVDLGIEPGTPGFPLLAWMPEGRSEVALAVQPAALRALRDAELAYVEDPVASDVHAFLDLGQGYLLRRKLWQLAVRDRSLADWRRSGRLARIAAALGLEDDAPELVDLTGRGVFSRPGLPASLGGNALPDLLEPGERGGRSWGSAATAFDQLPTPLLALERLDAYLAIEPDALLFETRLAFDLPEDAEAAIDAPPQAAAATELDFDAAE